MQTDTVDTVLVNALQAQSVFDSRWKMVKHTHVVDQGLCRSSLTSTGRLRCQDHTSMPLYTLSNAFSSILSSRIVPAPRPFSPFSNSSSRRKFRGTLAPMFAGCRAEGCAGVSRVRKWDGSAPPLIGARQYGREAKIKRDQK